MTRPRVVAALSMALLSAACVAPLESGGGGGGGGGAPDSGIHVDAARAVDAAPTADQLVAEWSGCMTLDSFTAANMIAWANVATTLNQRCGGCHTGGAEGFIASPDPAIMFKAISEQKTFLLQYFTVDSAAGKMIVNTASFLGVNGSGHPTHPRFNAMVNAGMTALQAFYTTTAAKQAAHTCDPPRLVP